MAVAGGQVSDRPLTKVLAADVAALPVVDAESDPLCEPLASGGFDCTSALSEGAQDGPGSGDDPAGGEEDTGSVLDALPDLASPDPGDVPRRSRIVTVAGGSVSLAVQGDDIRVVWWIPQYGYNVTLDYSVLDAPRVLFTRGTVQNGVVARLVDGGLVVDTFEAIDETAPQ
jgi:hypothetical protein